MNYIIYYIKKEPPTTFKSNLNITLIGLMLFIVLLKLTSYFF